MSLRDKMNQNPAIAGGITGGVLLIALIMIILSFRGSGPEVSSTTKDFYTVDDGASSFVDEAFPNRIPPYQYNGKTAFRAHVWTCDGGNTTFVSGVQKFNENAKKTLDGIMAAKNLQDPRLTIVAETWEGSMLKLAKTGDTPDKWFPYNDMKSTAILFPTCPPGKTLEKPVPK